MQGWRWCSPAAQSHLFWRSTTAFLSVSTASLEPVSATQQQMQALVKHFAALDSYGFLSPTNRKVQWSGQVLVSRADGIWNEVYLYSLMKPQTVGSDPNSGRNCSSRLKRVAGNGNRGHQCHRYLCYVLQLLSLVSNVFRLHGNTA